MSKSNNSRFTSFVFTVNNYTPEDLNRINDSNWNSVFKYIVYGLEKGEVKNTPHIQARS